MSDYIIATSSTSDLPRTWLEEHNIPFIAYSYTVNDEPREDDCREETRAAVYAGMRRGDKLHTSMINEFVYYDFLKTFLDEGKDVIFLDMSQKMSVSFVNANKAADKLRAEFPERKLYVSQAKKGEKYSELQPVYSLNLINDICAHDTPDFIHNYRIVHDKDSNKIIEGLHFTFIELPKFTPHSIADKRMMVLWLRFLTEINSNTKDIPADLLNDPEIGKAVEDLEVSGFTDAELRAYDKFWDSVSVERTLIDDSYQKGKEKGKEEGIAEGMEKGRAEGKHEANTETAFSPYLNHMRKFSLDKLHQILKKWHVERIVLIMSKIISCISLLLSYICHRKEPINVLILKTIFKPIKYIKLMKKLFTLVCGVLFAMFANAATLDIGEPSNNVKDGETV